MGKTHNMPKRDCGKSGFSQYQRNVVRPRYDNLKLLPNNNTKQMKKKQQKIKFKKVLEKGLDMVQDSLSDSLSNLNISSLDEYCPGQVKDNHNDTVVKYFLEINDLDDMNKENKDPNLTVQKKESKLKPNKSSAMAEVTNVNSSTALKDNYVNNKKVFQPNSLLHEVMKNLNNPTSEKEKMKPKIKITEQNGNINNNKTAETNKNKTSSCKNVKVKEASPLLDMNLSYLEELKADIEKQLQTDRAVKVRKSYIPEPDMNESIEQYGNNYYAPKREVKTKLRPVYIDGSNVALGFTQGRYFSVTALKICIDYFLKRGHEVHAFVPHFRKYNCSNPLLFNDLMKNGLIITTPSRYINGRKVTPYDDRYIVKCAAVNKGVIVSCDNYRDLIEENPSLKPVIEQRLLMPLWVNDMLIFPDDPLGRTGPTLEEFLRF